ncbi:MAG: hypothetical protein ACRD2G_06305 [Terriglobia bacterium]
MPDVPEISPLELPPMPDPPERRQFHLKRDTVRKPSAPSPVENQDLDPGEDEEKPGLDVTA